MFKYGISCSLELQPVRQPVIIRGEIEHVAHEVKRAGYDAIELFIRDPKQYDSARLNKAAKDQGLGFCAISTGMEFTRNGLCLIDDDADKRRKAVDRLKEHIELGAVNGAYQLNTEVELTEMLGDNTNVYVTAGEDKAILKVDPHDTPEIDEKITFSIPVENVYLFDGETEMVIK